MGVGGVVVHGNDGACHAIANLMALLDGGERHRVVEHVFLIDRA